MAEFNPDQNPVSPDWTGASKGFKANTAGAELFNDLGTAAVTAIGIADQNNTQNIQQEVDVEVQRLNNEWGTGASAFETSVNAKNLQPAPEDITRYGKQLADVRKAYMNGTLKDSNYQMRIDSLSRQIRARYPGYQDVIDSTIQQTLGRSTANDLRKSLMAQWNAEMSESNDAKNRFEAEVTAARKTGDLPPDYDLKAANGNPYTADQTRVYMAASYNRKARVQQLDAELSLATKQGTATTEQQIKSAQATIGLLVSKNMEGALSAADKTPAQVLDMVNSGRTKTLSPQELVEVQTQAVKLKTTMETQINKVLLRPEYVTLPEEEKKKIRENAMEPYNVISEAVFNTQYGIVHASKITNDATVENAIRNIEDQNPVVAGVRAAQKLGSSEAFNSVLMMNPAMQTAVDDAILAVTTSKLFKTGPGNDSQLSVLKDTEAKSGVKLSPQVIKATNDASVRMLLDSKAPLAVAQKAADNLFSENNQDFLSAFKPDDRMTLFQTFVSPRITARMVEIGKDSPQSLYNYTQWVQNAGVALFKKDVDTINDQNLYGDFVRFSYNPEAMRVEAVPMDPQVLAGRIRGGPLGEISNAWESYKASESKKSVDNLNKYLAQLKPVLEAVGDNPQEKVQVLLQQMGVGQGENVGGLWTRLGKAIGKLPEEGKPISPQGGRGSKAKTVSEDLKQFDLSTENTGVTSGDPLKDTIARAEGGKNYNTRYGGADDVELSNYSVSEILTMQKVWQGQTGSSATGRYQVMRETLADLVARGVVSADEPFTPQLQERIADTLIAQAKEGTKTKEQLAKKLAGIWAGLPSGPDNTSPYTGVGLNKGPTISWDDFLGGF